MKKIYVCPAVLYISTESSQMICASPTYKVNNGTQIGATSEQSPYANDDWVNEGLSGGTTVGGYNVIPGGDDEEDLPSRAKGTSIWEW